MYAVRQRAEELPVQVSFASPSRLPVNRAYCLGIIPSPGQGVVQEAKETLTKDLSGVTVGSGAWFDECTEYLSSGAERHTRESKEHTVI